MRVTIFPTPDGMTWEEKVWALGRFVILVTILLFVLGFGSWWLFLLLGLITVLIIYYIEKSTHTIDIKEDEKEE